MNIFYPRLEAVLSASAARCYAPPMTLCKSLSTQTSWPVCLSTRPSPISPPRMFLINCKAELLKHRVFLPIIFPSIVEGRGLGRDWQLVRDSDCPAVGGGGWGPWLCESLGVLSGASTWAETLC